MIVLAKRSFSSLIRVFFLESQRSGNFSLKETPETRLSESGRLVELKLGGQLEEMLARFRVSEHISEIHLTGEMFENLCIPLSARARQNGQLEFLCSGKHI